MPQSSYSSDILNLEEVLYVIQRKHPKTGEWRAEGLAIMGRTQAHEILNDYNNKSPRGHFRAVQKEYADAYRQGWKDAMEFANQHGAIIEKVYEEMVRRYDGEATCSSKT